MPLLHANSFGSGEDLVILHGFLGTSDNWKSLGKAYADAGFRLHLLDQRNHGRSFHSSANFLIPLWQKTSWTTSLSMALKKQRF